MLQRIQTVYLLAIVILSGVTLFSPWVGFYNAAEALGYMMDFKGITLLQRTGNILQSYVWGLTALVALVPIISLFAIFKFKKRIIQLRLCIINMLVMASFYVLLFIYIWFADRALDTEWHLKLVTVFPLINMVLNYLAIRGIAKDEALVKSLDRLR